mgnify:CR=1 FL=1
MVYKRQHDPPQKTIACGKSLAPRITTDLVFVQGKCSNCKIFRRRRFSLCVTLRKMFKFPEIFRLRRFSLCVPLRNCLFSKIPRLRRFPLCASLRKMFKIKDFPPQAVSPLCVPKANIRRTWPRPIPRNLPQLRKSPTFCREMIFWDILRNPDKSREIQGK